MVKGFLRVVAVGLVKGCCGRGCRQSAGDWQLLWFGWKERQQKAGRSVKGQ
ncbi:hypothetical protein OIU77_024851 [Salix suchowensis]|uniref:Uncharacterized protein n=1 Tax=Salix suchowensis TaxID=1278906 RepID=A0ABQ9BU74_9ROSI|nr:hypothetical protein OIU77_024851 [Salix suchowensis]